MLTGKDVYEATLFATSDIAGKWDKLNTFDKYVYEVAASVLNGNHIAPMQDRMKRLESNERATFSDALHIIGDTLTDAMTVASDLQSQITALKALDEKYRAKHAATRVLLSECYAEIDVLLGMSEPTPEEAQAREESLKSLQQRIYDYLRSDDEVKS